MAKQALEGLKVVELCWVIAGPLVGLYLAHHGATVIRVESSVHPDLYRTIEPYKDGIKHPDRALSFVGWNSNKLEMGINLTHPKGVEIAKRLIAWADIVGENFAPGVLEKMGLGYEEVRKAKPDIIMFSTSNLGQTGPEARQPGYGIQLVSYAGFTHVTGWPDKVPAQPYGAYTDVPAPRFMVATLLAAIEYRRRTGKGQYLDMSQMETGAQLLGPAIMDYSVNKHIWNRDGNRCPYAAPHAAYPCRGDDRWCAIGVFTDEEWSALCWVMGDPDWAKEAKFATLLGRKANEAELNERVGEWTRSLTAEEVAERLQAAGVPAGVVKNAADVFVDAQMAYRHYFQVLDHPAIGRFHYEKAGGFILSKTPAEIKMAAPLLGQHTEYVCRELLHMSDEEFVDLRRQGVFE